LRRREIVDGIVQVVSALESSRLSDRLLPHQEHKPEELLDGFQLYTLAADHFNEAGREVAKRLGLEALLSSEFWGRALFRTTEGPTDPSVTEIYHGVVFIQNGLPRLLSVLEQESDTLRARDGDQKKSSSILTVQLPEEADQRSNPQRIADLMLAVSSIYEGLAVLKRQSETTLSVISCDSGGDKSFDFLGLANLVEDLKEILLGLWDRVVFYRELQMGQRLELVAQSLPVLEQIRTLQENGSLESEQAELVRRRIIDGCTKFLNCGAVIPEMEDRSHFSPRTLMATQPKLLTGATKPQ
jgi:hypothetical protein